MTSQADPTAVPDEFSWLEDVEGDVALAWVRERNAETVGTLFQDPLFEQLRSSILALLESDDRIPMPDRLGDQVLNFWTDATHPRGVLRRTSWDEYVAGEPAWEILLDVDALSAAEATSWVFAGYAVQKPGCRRALIGLSPGGSDASTTREFDLIEKRFITADEGGFVRPVGKGGLTWIDEDTVYAAHTFDAASVTTSGYPRTVRRWTRGTDLSDAPVVFEGDNTDVLVTVGVSTLEGFRHHTFVRMIDFFHSAHFIVRDGEIVRIDAPEHADVSVRERWIVIRPREDWTVGNETFPAGSLIVADLDDYLAGTAALRVVFTPTESTSLSNLGWTRHHLLLGVQQHVRDRVEVVTPGDSWSRRPLAGAPAGWTVMPAGTDPDHTDECYLVTTDFVTPTTLLHTTIDAEAPASILRSAPTQFDASGLSIEQHFAASSDGTEIPYFLVGPAGGVTAPIPTLLGGYGGFEVSNTAAYSGVVGQAWLARGGVYVLANIRGGGEYGPKWHRAGLRENRHRVYEDFEAVAHDLIARGITTPQQLGITGGSNGGLLVGNMYVRTPELFGAVVCQVPLLDMKRYSHLHAGASWMAEYGDPDDPADWEFIRTFSPYHLVERDRTYPPMLLTTSTRDDRVHPSHARKMAARLTELGHDVTYWENIEGGHGGAADAPQQAIMSALAYTFLHGHLFGS